MTTHRDSRSISCGRLRGQLPAFAAVVSESGHVFRLRWFFIISAHCHSIFAGPEHKRENASCRGAMNDRRLRHSPGLSAIRRMKDSRGRAAGPKPDIVFAESRDAGAAGGECAFAGQRCGHFLDRHRIPGHAIRSKNQREFAIDGITERDSVCHVPESKAIVERFGIFVGELKLPDPAAVRGFVDARLLTRANAEDERRVLVEGLDIAKVQGAGPDEVQRLPGSTSV